jgi:hypothetical protein
MQFVEFFMIVKEGNIQQQKDSGTKRGGKNNTQCKKVNYQLQ